MTRDRSVRRDMVWAKETVIPKFAVLTSSDMGARGERQDTGGDGVVEMLESVGFGLEARVVAPDERPVIADQLRRWCDTGQVELICTTGGTGLSPRDVTPEATADVIDFEVPGMAEAMRAHTFDITPFTMVSRAKVGVRGRVLIVNLPGNPKGARECLEVVIPVLSHAIEVLQGRRGPHPARGSAE